MRRGHQLDRLLGARAARRALPAAFVLEKPQQVQRYRSDVVLVREHDHRSRTDQAALGFECPEIEWNVRERGGQNAARGAARQIALEVMAFGHAAAILVDQLARGDAGRRELDPRVLDAPGHREGAAAIAAIATLPSEPLGALLDDVADPVEGLDVVDQSRPAKEPDLRWEGRLVARETALAFNALEHRRFVAADIGTGTAAEMDPRVRRQTGRLDRGDLACENRAALWVFVAEIDIDLSRLDHPRRDQHAFDHAVWIGFEKIAILEGAGLALVGVDHEQPRSRLLPHEAPFAPGRKPRAAEPAQTRMLKDLDQFLGLMFTVEAGLE